MFFHVTDRFGVIYETDCEQKATSIVQSVKDVTVRAGPLVALREESLRLYGKGWLQGPSAFTGATPKPNTSLYQDSARRITEGKMVHTSITELSQYLERNFVPRIQLVEGLIDEAA